MTRADWQQLAEERLLAAQELLATRPSSAYYLAGYAVECGLKSCIVARVTGEPEVIFQEKGFSQKCWTHVIEELVHLAGLQDVLDAAIGGNSTLKRNWDIAKKWKESSRYELKTVAEAQELFQAIADDPDGVMIWVEVHW